jgi:serine/threonine protein kinase
MHQGGWIHRDLKADNIFLSDAGRVAIGDLGLAVRLDDPDIASRVVGTPHWIAPEVIKDAAYSPAVDVWGVGVICRELAEGAAPNADIPPVRVLDLIAASGLPPLLHPERFSADFLDFLGKCNAFLPDARASVSELLAHPFLARACPKAQIVAYIQRAQQARSDDVFARD